MYYPVTPFTIYKVAAMITLVIETENMAARKEELNTDSCNQLCSQALNTDTSIRII